LQRVNRLNVSGSTVFSIIADLAENGFPSRAEPGCRLTEQTCYGARKPSEDWLYRTEIAQEICFLVGESVRKTSRHALPHLRLNCSTRDALQTSAQRICTAFTANELPPLGRARKVIANQPYGQPQTHFFIADRANHYLGYDCKQLFHKDAPFHGRIPYSIELFRLISCPTTDYR
jgi:transposase